MRVFLLYSYMHTMNLPPCHCFCLHSVFSSSLTRGIGVGPDQLQGRGSEGIHGGKGPAMKPRMPGLCPWCGSLWPAWRAWGGILKMWTLHLQFVSFWNRWEMCASLGIWKNLITWLTFVVIQYFFEVFSSISFSKFVVPAWHELPATKAAKEFRQHQARCQAAAEAWSHVGRVKDLGQTTVGFWKFHIISGVFPHFFFRDSLDLLIDCGWWDWIFPPGNSAGTPGWNWRTPTAARRAAEKDGRSYAGAFKIFQGSLSVSISCVFQSVRFHSRFDTEWYLYIVYTCSVAPLVWFHLSPAVCIPPFALGEGPLRSLAGARAGIGASACEGGCRGSAPGTGKVVDRWTILARFVYDFFGWRSFGYRELKLKTERFFDDQNE